MLSGGNLNCGYEPGAPQLKLSEERILGTVPEAVAGAGRSHQPLTHEQQA